MFEHHERQLAVAQREAPILCPVLQTEEKFGEVDSFSFVIAPVYLASAFKCPGHDSFDYSVVHHPLR